VHRSTEDNPELEGAFDCFEEANIRGSFGNVLMPDCVALYAYGKCVLYQKLDDGNIWERVN
jgi:hypothetical protein